MYQEWCSFHTYRWQTYPGASNQDQGLIVSCPEVSVDSPREKVSRSITYYLQMRGEKYYDVPVRESVWMDSNPGDEYNLKDGRLDIQ